MLQVICGFVVGLLLAGLGFGLVGGVIGIVGIILGVQGKKDPAKKGMATAGFVCSIIGTILCLLMYIACAACVGGIAALA